MPNTIQHIAAGLNATLLLRQPVIIEDLLIDSRKLLDPSPTLYFAITTSQNDGHKYIPDLVKKGVLSFVVNKQFDTSPFVATNFIIVDDVIDALQQIATLHRATFSYPVIGITGSNGKTIVKEWLNELLSDRFKIVRSPRSYNSQIGVPLSIWGMSDQHELAIIEAGVSEKGEMKKLAEIIQPSIGIITNLGAAHAQGFSNDKEKLAEKLILFEKAAMVIGPFDLLQSAKFSSNQQIITWGATQAANLFIQNSIIEKETSTVLATYNNQQVALKLPFIDAVSIENGITCWLTLLQMGLPMEEIQQKIMKLQHLDMRLQIKKGINDCFILNDSYSNDLHALALGIAFAKQRAGNLPLTLIISDFANISTLDVYENIIDQLPHWGIKKLITVGPQWKKELLQNKNIGGQQIIVKSFNDTASLLAGLDPQTCKQEFIMIKGARAFELEQVSAKLQYQVHETVLEVNLTALINNYKKIKNQVGASVKVMAMVKAFGYGSGSVEVARSLQLQEVGYLAVAYVDEGVELRKAGIHVPIMIMNTDAAAFELLVQYHLEPEIYSFEQLTLFSNFIQQQGIQNFPVHLKLNTGMNRLGFDLPDIDSLSIRLASMPFLKVKSIFSHLSASGQEAHAAFTKKQLEQFTAAATSIENKIGYPTLKHIANSDAVIEDAKYNLDMVRVGIGMYGIKPGKLQLEMVVQMFTTIAQIRNISSEQTVGYNRAGIVKRPTTVATVRLGYADGYHRKLGRGNGKMWVNGQLVPIIGDVCMDMIMLDVTDCKNVKVGDRVEVFGAHLPITDLAYWGDTITYEILTSIGQRVKRIYIQD